MKNIIVFIILFSTSLAYAQESEFNVTGTWTGIYYASQVGHGTQATMVTLTLVQYGDNQITGQYFTGNGLHGSGDGLVTGPNTFEMNWVNSTLSCPGHYHNNYTLENPDKIEWKFTGEDCLGSESGHGKASKRD